ncbi:MAG: 5-formyltetrahydrofolate cyclo-ligase [Acidobacteriota bacterium]
MRTPTNRLDLALQRLGASARARRKRDLRAEMRERLANQSPDDARRKSDRITQHALETPEVAHADGVFLCLSYGTEVDTWGLVDQLLQNGQRVYVPRADRDSHRLHVHAYPCPLETLSFGLQQPPRSEPSIASHRLHELIDVILVPGLSFTRHGDRLGQGGGYFDRFLAAAPTPALGLAFDFQLVDDLPIEPHDVPMRAVITERGVVRARTAAEVGLD